jgi:hypothetical protein
VSGELSLEPGRYAIVPHNAAPCAETDPSRLFVLELHASARLDLDVPVEAEGLPEPGADEGADSGDDEENPGTLDNDQGQLAPEPQDDEEVEDDARELSALAAQVLCCSSLAPSS